MATGICLYCGQMREIPGAEPQTEEERHVRATEACSCQEAKEERKAKKLLAAAMHRVDQLFGESAPKYGFQPQGEKAEYLKRIVCDVVAFALDKATVIFDENVKCTIIRRPGGTIRVERSETKKAKLEGEECEE